MVASGSLDEKRQIAYQGFLFTITSVHLQAFLLSFLLLTWIIDIEQANLISPLVYSVCGLS
jgi:hypothetical protein